MDFYEKALFVKSRRGGPIVVECIGSVCPSRYSSIRTVNTLWAVADDAPGGPDPASSRAESALVATRQSTPGVVP
jgi:hypothetical protein